MSVNTTTDAVPGALMNSTLYKVASNVVVGDFNNDGNDDVATGDHRLANR